MTSRSASHLSTSPDSSSCRLRFRRGWGSGCVMLLSVGCTTGQIGGEIDGKPGGEDASSGQCEEVASLSVDVDEQTNLGISAQDLIEAIEGTHEASMNWTATSPFEGVTVKPESGASSITVAIEVDEESAALVDLEPRKNDDGQETDLALDGESCSDELRIDAMVTVVTENGALHDTFPATFSSTNGHLVRANIPLPQEIEGSFSVDVSSLENGGHQERLELAFVLGTMSGSLSGYVETNNGEVATAGGTTYAEFPTGGECEYGYAVDAESEWVTEIETTLAQHTAFQLTWDGGSSTSLTVAPTVDVVCYEDNQSTGEGSLHAVLSADVTTGDASITGTWDLAARVELQSDGSMGEVSVFRDNYLGATYSVEEFEQETGITGVESTADGLSFQFGYVIPSDPEVSTYGSIAILEATIADCVTEDPEIEESPDGGASAPGCSGTDYTEIQTGTLSAVD